MERNERVPVSSSVASPSGSGATGACKEDVYCTAVVIHTAQDCLRDAARRS